MFEAALASGIAPERKKKTPRKNAKSAAGPSSAAGPPPSAGLFADICPETSPFSETGPFADADLFSDAGPSYDAGPSPDADSTPKGKGKGKGKGKRAADGPPPGSTSHADKRPKRVWKACERCRMKKTKCNGEFPCERCKIDGLVCLPGTRKRTDYKQVPKGYAEVLENTQYALVSTVHKLYEMLRNGEQWPHEEPELNDKGVPIIHDIAEKLGCIRPHNDLDLPVQTPFPETEQQMGQLANELNDHHARVHQQVNSAGVMIPGPPILGQVSPMVAHASPMGDDASPMVSHASPMMARASLGQASAIVGHPVFAQALAQAQDNAHLHVHAQMHAQALAPDDTGNIHAHAQMHAQALAHDDAETARAMGHLYATTGEEFQQQTQTQAQAAFDMPTQQLPLMPPQTFEDNAPSSSEMVTSNSSHGSVITLVSDRFESPDFGTCLDDNPLGLNSMTSTPFAPPAFPAAQTFNQPTMDGMAFEALQNVTFSAHIPQTSFTVPAMTNPPSFGMEFDAMRGDPWGDPWAETFPTHMTLDDDYLFAKFMPTDDTVPIKPPQ